MLTIRDLDAIRRIVEETVEHKLEQKFNTKLQSIYEFIDFAKTALLSLLDESQERFEQKIPQRVKKLEDIHPGGHHPS